MSKKINRSSYEPNPLGWLPSLFRAVVFYILPFCLLNGLIFLFVVSKPQIIIQDGDTKDYKTIGLTVKIKSLLPLEEFSATQEEVPIELAPGKKNEYSATLTRNGVIEIYVKGINGMSAVAHKHINVLDDIAPSVAEGYSIKEGILTLTLEDSQSGVDTDSVHATAPDNTILAPIETDRQNNTFRFEIGENQTLIIHANDLAGNTMQATFSTHLETLEPGQEIPQPETPQPEISQPEISQSEIAQPENAQPESGGAADESREDVGIYIQNPDV